MIFNTYDRTPKAKTPKWIKIVLISFFALFAVCLFYVGILISVDNRSVFPFLIVFLSVSFWGFVMATRLYDMRKAYIEIGNETIKIVDYPFFKKRERIVFLRDIKKAKWQGGGGVGAMTYIVFKNYKNRTLFRVIDVPETRSYFEGLGFEIT